ncbi:hypothetical protein COOONC_09495 [Cooperia oncophora]
MVYRKGPRKSYLSSQNEAIWVNQQCTILRDGITTADIPDYRLLFTLDNLIPIVCYTIMWYSLNMIVNVYCWTSWKEGLRRRRLVNLTTSLAHSTVEFAISGAFLFVYFCRNTRVMFASPFHYYSYTELQIILISMGYFIYDSLDMVFNETLNVSCIVLMLHHICSIFFLSMVLASHKFLLYAYWALMMEVSSIFLHCRGLLNQSKLSTTSMISLYKVVSYINIVTFVPFRFLIQLFLTLWTCVNIHNIPS